MKRSVPGLLVILLVVLSGSTSIAASRPLRHDTNDRADEALRIGASDNKMRNHHIATTLVSKEEASYYSSSGMWEMEDQEVEEGCGSDEEDCSRWRKMAEAHLDYIYTQHHPHH